MIAWRTTKRSPPPQAAGLQRILERDEYGEAVIPEAAGSNPAATLFLRLHPKAMPYTGARMDSPGKYPHLCLHLTYKGHKVSGFITRRPPTPSLSPPDSPGGRLLLAPAPPLQNARWRCVLKQRAGIYEFREIFLAGV